MSTLLQGDCLTQLQTLQNESIDAAIFDPPYGYSFMNKTWDIDVPSIDHFAAIFRVLKQGAFMCCMSAPRQDVYAKMIGNIQAAGFDIAFDSIEWTYLSGFPKAMNIAKAIDRRLLTQWVLSDETRKKQYQSLKSSDRLTFLKSYRKQWAKEVYKKEIQDHNYEHPGRQDRSYQTNSNVFSGDRGTDQVSPLIREELISPEAIEMDGCYTFSPKPTREFIIIAKKPAQESSYLDQALKHKNGGVWIDRCRIPSEYQDLIKKNAKGYCGSGDTGIYGWNNDTQRSCKDSEKPPLNKAEQKKILQKIYGGRLKHKITYGEVEQTGFKTRVSEDQEDPFEELYDLDLRGRFPANILVSDNILDVDEKENGFSNKFSLDRWWTVYFKNLPMEIQKTFPFLYIPKPSKREKNKGLDHFIPKRVKDGRETKIDNAFQRGETERKNIHPTVKPILLFSYLIEMFTKPGDIVVDPYMGSGTTGIAATITKRRFVGIELLQEYFDIAESRIAAEEILPNQQKLL